AAYAGSEAALSSSDGLVVASIGLKRAMASMSPVSATTEDRERSCSSWLGMSALRGCRSGGNGHCRASAAALPQRFQDVRLRPAVAPAPAAATRYPARTRTPGHGHGGR